MRSAKQSGGVAWLAVLAVAVCGVSMMDMSAQPIEAATHGSELREPEEVLRYEQDFVLESGRVTLEVMGIGNQELSVRIEHVDFTPCYQQGVPASRSRILRTVKEDSWRSFTILLDEEGTLFTIHPETQWGGVHKDTGLGVTHSVEQA